MTGRGDLSHEIIIAFLILVRRIFPWRVKASCQPQINICPLQNKNRGEIGWKMLAMAAVPPKGYTAAFGFNFT
jgi:hypothetical protein